MKLDMILLYWTASSFFFFFFWLFLIRPLFLFLLSRIIHCPLYIPYLLWCSMFVIIFARTTKEELIDFLSSGLQFKLRIFFVLDQETSQNRLDQKLIFLFLCIWLLILMFIVPSYSCNLLHIWFWKYVIGTVVFCFQVTAMVFPAYRILIACGVHKCQSLMFHELLWKLGAEEGSVKCKITFKRANDFKSLFTNLWFERE